MSCLTSTYPVYPLHVLSTLHISSPPSTYHIYTLHLHLLYIASTLYIISFPLSIYPLNPLDTQSTFYIVSPPSRYPVHPLHTLSTSTYPVYLLHILSNPLDILSTLHISIYLCNVIYILSTLYISFILISKVTHPTHIAYMLCNYWVSIWRKNLHFLISIKISVWD